MSCWKTSPTSRPSPEAGNGAEATALAARLEPDVVLMDLRMPDVDGVTATARIRADHPAVRVLVLTI